MEGYTRPPSPITSSMPNVDATQREADTHTSTELSSCAQLDREVSELVLRTINERLWNYAQKHPRKTRKAEDSRSKTSFHSGSCKKNARYCLASLQQYMPRTPYFNVASACIVNLPEHKRAFFSLAPEHSKTTNIEVGGVGEFKQIRN